MLKLFSNQKEKNQVTANTNIKKFLPQNAPPQSIKGNVTDMSGSVSWQSRIATESAKLTTLRQIQQGEKLETGDDGNISVDFPNYANIKLLPESKIDFIQTLSANFVINQEKGSVAYTSLGRTHLSIRYLHLLTDMQSGQISVNIDKNKPTVRVLIIKGQITAAYNDSENVSQEKTFSQGQQFTFDDKKRELIF